VTGSWMGELWEIGGGGCIGGKRREISLWLTDNCGPSVFCLVPVPRSPLWIMRGMGRQMEKWPALTKFFWAGRLGKNFTSGAPYGV
jgi:hypothetical protein